MSIIYLAAVASAITFVPPAGDGPRQARVSYSDLNLASTAGQDQLDRRLNLALKMVCGRESGQSGKEWLAARQCEKRAMTQIAPQRAIAIAQSGTRLAGRF